MRIRNAKTEDLEDILKIYANARTYMHSNGNPHQWPDESYPSKDLLVEDIGLKRLFVVVDELTDEIYGVYAYILGVDPTYVVIENGSWINEEPYGTIHRMASSGRAKGVAHFIFDWALEQCPNLRGDTHADNHIMQSNCEAYGFKMCGIIHLQNGDPRIAYQVTKDIRKNREKA